MAVPTHVPSTRVPKREAPPTVPPIAGSLAPSAATPQAVQLASAGMAAAALVLLAAPRAVAVREAITNGGRVALVPPPRKGAAGAEVEVRGAQLRADAGATGVVVPRAAPVPVPARVPGHQAVGFLGQGRPSSPAGPARPVPASSCAAAAPIVRTGRAHRGTKAP